MREAVLVTAALAMAAAAVVAATEVSLTLEQEAFVQAVRTKVAAAEKADTMVVRGTDGWLFFAGELRHLAAGPFWGEAAAKVARSAKPAYAAPMPAIVDFHRQLKALGVELIFVPVPPKAAVFPDKLTDAVAVKAGEPVPDVTPWLDAFVARLRAEGVEVLDLGPEFRAKREAEHGPVYCRTDTHWSGAGIVAAADAIAARLADRPWLKEAKRASYDAEWREAEITGDLVRMLPEGSEKPQAEKLSLRYVTNGGEPVQPDESSPVLLLGDSHTLVFHAGGDLHAVGAGLPDQLAFALGMPVDLIGTRGSGATPVRLTLARKALRDPSYLAGKKVVLWVLTARELTEAFQGWWPIPLTK